MTKAALQNKLQTRQGVTLIEVMMSLVILLFVFLGLLQATLLTIETNVDNTLRDEAVRVVTDRLNQLRTSGFTANRLNDTGGGLVDDADIGPPPVSAFVERSIRNMPPMRFTIQKEISDVGVNTKRVRLVVSWNYRNQPFSHTINASITR